jgi:hypothetical protein
MTSSIGYIPRNLIGKIIFIIGFMFVISGASCNCDDGDNLLDRSCNIIRTDNCDCLNGENMTCGSTVGECRTNTVYCTEGKWPECNPKVTPSPEICDGLDNDCDGDTDELAEVGSPRECWEGPEGVVFGANSSCQRGSQECRRGSWSFCNGQMLPTIELCDKFDNDCNGVIDDKPVGNDQHCGPVTDIGRCEWGIFKCIEGDLICVDDPTTSDVIEPITPQDERCNDVDDDCDGQTDEGLRQLCRTVCGVGEQTCARGVWGSCSAPEPQPEICDGFDNDCDGQIDEDCDCMQGSVELCHDGIVNQDGTPATCGRGVRTCDRGMWGRCVVPPNGPIPVVEICNNWDDDCDGRVDGLVGVCGNVALAGIGECRIGTTTCEMGIWGSCRGNVDPIPETCDGTDQDCDGVIDNGFDLSAVADIVFVIDISGSMCSFTSQVALGLQGFVTGLQSTDHRLAVIAFPGDGVNVPIAYMNSPPLVDAPTFAQTLGNLGCSGGGLEPGYNALHIVTSGSNPTINWRANSKKIIIYITDEPAQSLSGSLAVSEAQVAAQTMSCMLPGCSAGDRVDIHIITRAYFFNGYRNIVYGEFDRLIEIEPPDATRYEMIFQDIFSEVCRPVGP